MPTAIIADDERLMRDQLRLRLQQAWPELEILDEARNGEEAIELVHKHRPDIVFLDIRMPGISGLDVASASAGACHIVFTTAYDSHAIEAFGLGVVDYLLKPLTQERLQRTVARLRESMASAVGGADLLKAMTELERRLRAAAQEERIRWISTTSSSTIKIFPIDEVLFFESDSRYTR
ncbi:response regulator, partial [Oxalobacteraceae bacterium OM1]